jgi:hypothetical protein
MFVKKYFMPLLVLTIVLGMTFAFDAQASAADMATEMQKLSQDLQSGKIDMPTFQKQIRELQKQQFDQGMQQHKQAQQQAAQHPQKMEEAQAASVRNSQNAKAPVVQPFEPGKLIFYSGEGKKGQPARPGNTFPAGDTIIIALNLTDAMKKSMENSRILVNVSMAGNRAGGGFINDFDPKAKQLIYEHVFNPDGDYSVQIVARTKTLKVTETVLGAGKVTMTVPDRSPANFGGPLPEKFW